MILSVIPASVIAAIFMKSTFLYFGRNNKGSTRTLISLEMCLYR